MNKNLLEKKRLGRNFSVFKEDVSILCWKQVSCCTALAWAEGYQTCLLSGLSWHHNPLIIFYLAAQAGRPVQVLQVVLGVPSVLGNLGNQDCLCLLVDLGYQDLEYRGLPSLHLHLGILQWCGENCDSGQGIIFRYPDNQQITFDEKLGCVRFPSQSHPGDLLHVGYRHITKCKIIKEKNHSTQKKIDSQALTLF